jgi:hypothetical protein
MTKQTSKHKLWIPLLLTAFILLAFVGQASANTGKTPATQGEQPWMVGLVEAGTANARDGHFCGGSLIAPDWVLTAAHCLEGIASPDEVDLVIGRHQLSSNAGERIPAAELLLHKGYPDYADGEDNDIALIRLSRPATQGTPISLITAATAAIDDPGQMARVTGWGVLSEDGETTPDLLHGVNVPVVSQAACEAIYGADLQPDGLCAGLEQGGADSCYGDSGGPLVVADKNGKPIQIGVVSWGDECGASGNYGVYARLTEYEAWINGVMAGTVETIEPDDVPHSDGAGEWDEDWADEGWDDGEWDDVEWDDVEWDDNGVDDGQTGSAILELNTIDLPAGFEVHWFDSSADILDVGYGTDDGDYVDIYAEEGEWAFSADDQPFIETINGVDVLRDWDGDSEIALFNVDGYGVEIYGTISETEMLDLLDSILA